MYVTEEQEMTEREQMEGDVVMIWILLPSSLSPLITVTVAACVLALSYHLMCLLSLCISVYVCVGGCLPGGNVLYSNLIV